MALPLAGIEAAVNGLTIDGGQAQAQLAGSMQSPAGFYVSNFAGDLVTSFGNGVAVNHYIFGQRAFPGIAYFGGPGTQLCAHPHRHFRSGRNSGRTGQQCRAQQ